jgi:thiol-disulfide isomerase/thioredoxin
MSRTETNNRWRRPVVGPFNLIQLGAVLAAVGVTAVALLVLTAPLAGSPQPTVPATGSGFVTVGQQTAGLRIGDEAPELLGTVDGQQVGLTDLDGNPIRLADLRGRPVWVNFWASWCPPCQQETPVLRDLYDAHKDAGLALVAISVQETTPDDVRAYVERYGLDYTVGFDATSAIFHAYQGYGLPTQIFIDRTGIIRNIVLGPVTRDQAEQILAPLLAS